MRVVVAGATGNIGSALVRALVTAGHEPVGVARRLPSQVDAGWVASAEWLAADLTTARGRLHLWDALQRADAYVHLAWPLQPMRRPAYLHHAGPETMLACLRLALDAGVHHAVHLSSVAAYAPAPHTVLVDEDWPLGGVPTSTYARHKAEAERRLWAELSSHSAQERVTVLRPCLVAHREAGSLMTRCGTPALMPNALVCHLRAVPVVHGFALQMVHADDVAAAVAAALEQGAAGAFNLAGDGTVSGEDIAVALGANGFHVPAGLLRRVAAGAWHTHVSPMDPGWVDMASFAPHMSTEKARGELGWRPRHTASAVLRGLIAGMAEGASGGTPPLRARTVWGELRTAARHGPMSRRTRI